MDYTSSDRLDSPSLAVRLMQVAGEYEVERKRERQRLETKISTTAEENATLLRTVQELKETNNSLNRQITKLNEDLETSASSQDNRVRLLEQALMLSRFELADRTEALLSLHEQIHQLSEKCEETVTTAGDTLLYLLPMDDDEDDNENVDQLEDNENQEEPTMKTGSKKENKENQGGIVISLSKQKPQSKIHSKQRSNNRESSRAILSSLLPNLRAVSTAASALSASGTLLSELRVASRETKRYSKETLLHAAETGNEGLFKLILNSNDIGTVSNTSLPFGLRSTASPSSSFLSSSSSSASLASTFNTALRQAVRNGHVNIVKQLLSVGTNINHRTHEDGLLQTILHVAAQYGHESILKLLLTKEGLDSVPGYKAIMSATTVQLTTSNASVVSLAGLKLDEKDAYYRTPLHLAAANNHGKVVTLLLHQGADPYAKDIQNLTPKDIANGTMSLYHRAMSQMNAESTKGQKHPHKHSSAYPYFASGELVPNASCPSAISAFADTYIMFWNATLRANRYYNEKRFALALECYTLAIDLALQTPGTKNPRDLATLHYNRARTQYRLGRHCAAIDDCNNALKHDSSYRNALAQCAESYMSLFDFERAARNFASLLDSNSNDRQWALRLLDAQSMRDMSHYGILGVSKNSDISTIKKAYRSLCLRWHPDKHENGPEDMARANAAFRRITTAWETLSDSYKRMIYDMDPASNTGTPLANLRSKSSSSSASDTSGTSEGLDVWYQREREKETTQDNERISLEKKDKVDDEREEEIRVAARSLRLRILRVKEDNNNEHDDESKDNNNDTKPNVRKTNTVPIDTRTSSTVIRDHRSNVYVIPSSSSSSIGHQPSPPLPLPKRPPPVPGSQTTTTTTTQAAEAAIKAAAAVSAAKVRIAFTVPMDKETPVPSSTSSSSGTGIPSLKTEPSTQSNQHPEDDQIYGTASATAAKARATVAQAEAFVRLVQAHASLAEAERRHQQPTETNSSATYTDDDEDTMDDDNDHYTDDIEEDIAIDEHDEDDDDDTNTTNGTENNNNNDDKVYTDTTTTSKGFYPRNPRIVIDEKDIDPMNDSQTTESTTNAFHDIDIDNNLSTEERAAIRARMYARARAEAQARLKEEIASLRKDAGMIEREEEGEEEGVERPNGYRNNPDTASSIPNKSPSLASKYVESARYYTEGQKFTTKYVSTSSPSPPPSNNDENDNDDSFPQRVSPPKTTINSTMNEEQDIDKLLNTMGFNPLRFVSSSNGETNVTSSYKNARDYLMRSASMDNSAFSLSSSSETNRSSEFSRKTSGNTLPKTNLYDIPNYKETFVIPSKYTQAGTTPTEKSTKDDDGPHSQKLPGYFPSAEEFDTLDDDELLQRLYSTNSLNSAKNGPKFSFASSLNSAPISTSISSDDRLDGTTTGPSPRMNTVNSNYFKAMGIHLDKIEKELDPSKQYYSSAFTDQTTNDKEKNRSSTTDGSNRANTSPYDDDFNGQTLEEELAADLDKLTAEAFAAAARVTSGRNSSHQINTYNNEHNDDE